VSVRRPLTEREIRTLPLRDLAWRLLAEMHPTQPIDVGNVIGRVVDSLPLPTGTLRVGGRSWLSEPELTRLLGEAWDWLYINGLTACEPTRTSTRFITRYGKLVLEDATRLPK
jgi:hypothetical protein